MAWPSGRLARRCLSWGKASALCSCCSRLTSTLYLRTQYPHGSTQTCAKLLARTSCRATSPPSRATTKRLFMWRSCLSSRSTSHSAASRSRTAATGAGVTCATRGALCHCRPARKIWCRTWPSTFSFSRLSSSGWRATRVSRLPVTASTCGGWQRHTSCSSSASPCSSASSTSSTSVSCSCSCRC